MAAHQNFDSLKWIIRNHGYVHTSMIPNREVGNFLLIHRHCLLWVMVVALVILLLLLLLVMGMVVVVVVVVVVHDSSMKKNYLFSVWWGFKVVCHAIFGSSAFCHEIFDFLVHILREGTVFIRTVCGIIMFTPLTTFGS